MQRKEYQNPDWVSVCSILSVIPLKQIMAIILKILAIISKIIAIIYFNRSTIEVRNIFYYLVKE